MNIIAKTLVGLLTVLSFGGLIARADDDDDDSHHRRVSQVERRSVAAPLNPTYKGECASCHMAFPPGLLPKRSWLRVLGGLGDHFGEDATVDKETADKISSYLTANAADNVANRRSQKIAKSIPVGESPLRITETLYFKRQHHEVGKKVWMRKSIGSSANCAACHMRAEQGVFSEDEIKIPR